VPAAYPGARNNLVQPATTWHPAARCTRPPLITPAQHQQLSQA
jgi:hypothetical protein